MAEFNQCSQLEVKDIHEKIINAGFDPLEEMLLLQRKLQEYIKEKKPEYKEYYGDVIGPDTPIKVIADFIMMQKQCIDDEIQELLQAIGGSEIGNASWKYWKTSHKIAKEKKFSELSEDEKKEAHMEVIDIWHFFMNIMLILGIDSKMMTNYYFSKNEENGRRQNEGY